jgi:hypothetical protein
MKSRLLKKFITYGFLPFMVVFLSVSPFLGINTAHAFNFWVNVAEGVGTVVAAFLVGINIILSSILYFIGKLLDFAIEYSIAPNTNSAAGPVSLYASETVNTAWTLLRDIINMSFIFILLYVAIGTVLNIQNINWKKQVSQIIIAAILVNFSLFLTRVVIDAGNIVANGFYQELTVCDPACVDFFGNSRESVGISERFAAALGITYVNELRDGTYDTGYIGWEGVGVGLMQMVLILTAIWVFFSVAILFIARIFALVFILVLSPIGVAGSSLPLLGKFAQEWREQLFKQAMLGVVFLFFTFVILLFASLEGEGILDGSTFSIDDVSEDQLPVKGPEGGPRTESIFITYTLVIAGLIMSLRLTKNLSGQAGQMMEGGLKKAVGVGFGVATGGLAMGLRRTVGGNAAKYLSSDAGKALKERADKGEDLAAIRKYRNIQGRATNTFDARTVKLGGLELGSMVTKQASKLGGVAGINAGIGMEAGKGGRLGSIDRIAEKENERYKDMSPAALRTMAGVMKEKAGTQWVPNKLVHGARASKLKKMADRKETNKEERERIIAGFVSKLRSEATDAGKVQTTMGDLQPADYRSLPEDVLVLPNVIDNYNVGELRAIGTTGLARKHKEAIYDRLTAPGSSASATVRRYLDDPENGWKK